MPEPNILQQQHAANSLSSILEEQANNNSNPIFRQSLVQVLSFKGHGKLMLICMIGILICAIYIGFSEHTIAIVKEIVDVSMTITLGLLAIFFTGYTLFQALSTKGTLVTLLTSTTSLYTSIIPLKKVQAPIYKVYNLYFLGISYYTTLIILLNFFLKIFLASIPEDFYIKAFSYTMNSALASILLIIYLLINVKLVLEVKSFLYNIYQSILVSDVSKLSN